jgi:hypothetical protein
VSKLSPGQLPKDPYGEYLIRLARHHRTKQMFWRQALGVPRGFWIPVAVTSELEEVTAAHLRAPFGQESEGLGFHMVALRDRRWKLLALIKEQQAVSPAIAAGGTGSAAGATAPALTVADPHRLGLQPRRRHGEPDR